MTLQLIKNLIKLIDKQSINDLLIPALGKKLKFNYFKNKNKYIYLIF